MRSDFKFKLKKALKEINTDINDDQCEKFKTLYCELIKYNEKVNLTSIVEEDEFILKHILDSLIPLKKNNGTNLEKEKAHQKPTVVTNDENKYNDLTIEDSTQKLRVLDIGAGAGFPSIPLKIMNNSLDMTCLDSVNKKVDWLNYISNKLDLNIENIHERAESLAFKNNYRESFDIVISRAVAELRTLLEYSIPFLKVNGLFYAYKSKGFEKELELAKNAINVLNIKLIKTIEFKNADLGERYILIFKKLKPTMNKYPRGQNKPRTNPI